MTLVFVKQEQGQNDFVVVELQTMYHRQDLSLGHTQTHTYKRNSFQVARDMVTPKNKNTKIPKKEETKKHTHEQETQTNAPQKTRYTEAFTCANDGEAAATDSTVNRRAWEMENKGAPATTLCNQCTCTQLKIENMSIQ